jgi:hypothetical protein
MVNTKGKSFVGVGTRIVPECQCFAKNFTKPLTCLPDYCFNGGTCSKDDWGDLRYFFTNKLLTLTGRFSVNLQTTCWLGIFKVNLSTSYWLVRLRQIIDTILVPTPTNDFPLVLTITGDCSSTTNLLWQPPLSQISFKHSSIFTITTVPPDTASNCHKQEKNTYSSYIQLNSI